MKVLVISHMYPSTFNRMSGIFVHKQVKALIRKGCEVKVISPIPFAPFPLTILKDKWRAYASVPGRDIVDGVEVFYPRYLEFPNSFMLEHSGYFMYLGLKNVVKDLYREFEFDIIHSHVAVPDGYAALLASKPYDVPIISTVHGQDFQVTINRNRACRERLFYVLERMNKVVVVSSKLRKVVQEKDFHEKIVVINNGIDPEDSVISRDKAQRDSGDSTIILSVSNLIKTKGIDLNLKALSMLIHKYPNIKYHIVGDGPERQNLESLAKGLSLHRNVSFLGRLTHGEAMKQMALSDIFSLPSWQEGFGVAYIEAMSQGKPVIAVKGEGIEDVIRDGENGFLVKPRNVEEIVNTMEYLLSHREEAAIIGQRARDDINNKYTWDSNAERTIKVYREILRK